MTPEAINSGINNICAKLVLPTAKGFEDICALGIRDVLFSALFYALCVLSTLAGVYFYKCYKNGERDAEGGVICFGVVAVFLFAVATIIGIDAVVYLVNPEAWGKFYLLSHLQEQPC